MTTRRWIADRWDGASAWLEGEQAAHLIRVLRGQPGMEFDVVVGDRVWRSVIAAISAGTVRFTVLKEIEAERALPITLLLSIFKFDRMEWIVEKATELGVERFTPMIAGRSEKHLAQAAPARVERWRRIAREAAKQSRRADVPVVDDPLPLLEAARSERERRPLLLLLAEEERATSLSLAIGQGGRESRVGVALAVGPEGGWTIEEDGLFASAGWQRVSLGPRILRAETAGIAATAVVAALLQGSGTGEPGT